MINYKYLTNFFIISAGIIMAFILNNNSVQKTNSKPIELLDANVKKDNFIIIGNLSAELPIGWVQEVPKSSMRLTQFKLPSNDSQYSDAELSVFNAIGGSTQDNLDRWYKQFDQIDGITSKEKARVRDFSIAGMKITITDLKGTFTGGGMPMSQSVRKENYRLLAAILETTNEKYYFKLIGHENVIDNWAVSFGEFVGNLRQI
tara:strand:- start:2998 stop:3606 length:609 start_codon:yes stop_codon:yes gene_type:complete